MKTRFVKQLLAIVLCLSLLCAPLAAVSVQAASYPDVKSGAWYYNAVNYVSAKGYMTGYQNGLFGPSSNLQRQDFVVALARISTVDLNTFRKGTGGLSDVARGSYYSSAICWAVNNSIISGYDNGKFGVGDKINREQVCTILYRYMGSPSVGSVSSTLSAYPDKASVSAFAKNAVVWALQQGIISGMDDGRLAPQASASRAQIATILMRMDQKGMFTTKRYTGITPALTPEEAVTIYMNYKSTWMEKPSYAPMYGYSYCLLDLDFDGVLELISSVNDGSGRYSYNNIYRINLSNNRVQSVTYRPDDEYSQFDYHYLNDSVLLYREKSSGKLFYYCEDYCRAYAGCYGSTYGKMYMQNSTVYEKSLFYTSVDGGQTTYGYHNGSSWVSISKSNYDQRIKNFKKDNLAMHLSWSKVSGSTFDSSSSSTQRSMLLSAYRAYSYDGFAF